MRARFVVPMLAAAAAGTLVAVGSARAATPSGFSIVAVPHIPGGQLKAVAATYDGGHTDVWAVGTQYKANGVDVPLILRSSGGAWHRVTLPWSLDSPAFLDGVVAAQGGHPGVWITADPGGTTADPNPAPLMLHWQPSGWTKTTVPGPDTYNGLGVVGTDPAGDVWAGGEASSSDDCCEYPYFDRLSGGSWSNVPFSPIENETLNAVQPLSATEAWATGRSIPDCCDGSTDSSLWHYTSGTWQYENLPCPAPVTEYCHANDLVTPAYSDANVWVVGSNQDQAAMWRWRGSALKLYEPWSYTTSHELFGVASRASNDIWAVGVRSDAANLDRTLIVHWNGTAWSDLGGPNGPIGGSRLSDITAAPTTGTLWAVGTTNEISGGGTIVDVEPLIMRHS